MPPKTVTELVEFYYDTVKPLYSSVQLTNTLPVEVLFEINAAFDHLTRMWAYDEGEEQVVSKAYSHLKRSCLDIFKLAVRTALDQFAELRRIDTSVIDNGDFDRRLVALISSIRQDSILARRNEGNAQTDDIHAVAAFEQWSPVYEKCVLLDKNFYQHPAVDWAVKKYRRSKFWELFVAFAVGVTTSVCANYLYELLCSKI